jgi:hypothetical protein
MVAQSIDGVVVAVQTQFLELEQNKNGMYQKKPDGGQRTRVLAPGLYIRDDARYLMILGPALPRTLS